MMEKELKTKGPKQFKFTNSYSIKVAKFIIDKVCKYYHMYPQTAIPNMSIVPSNDGITISFIFSEDVILTIDVSNKQTIKYNPLDDRCNKNMSYRQLLIHIPVILREYEYEIKRKYKK